RILALLNGKDDAAAITEQVAKLLGLASGSSPEAFWAVRRLFEALARDRPLAVVFDDMHWAEPTFVELVEHVAERAQAPILLLCLARSELFDTCPDFGQAGAGGSLLPLEPLDHVGASRLLAGLLAG